MRFCQSSVGGDSTEYKSSYGTAAPADAGQNGDRVCEGKACGQLPA